MPPCDKKRSNRRRRAMAHEAFTLEDATEAHLPGIRDIFNHAVRETFSIWSEQETTIEQRKAWLAARRRSTFPVIVALVHEKKPDVLGYGSFGVFRDFPGYVKTV